MRADRLLSILLLLRTERRVTARELARRLEVSERTILRDMDALSGAGVPVVAERGAGGGWSLIAEYQTKLTGMSAAELQSLFLARPRGLMADLGIAREAESAMIKLEAALPEISRRGAEFARQRILIDSKGWRDPGESVESLPALMDALWRGRRVRFVYARVLGEAGERLCDPMGLVAKGSAWYLIARRDEGEARTYRVSRISGVEVLEEAARIERFDLADYWARSAAEFRRQLPRVYATYRVAPAVMRWVRYRGWRVEEEAEEGDRVRVRIRFDAEEEAVQFGLSFGGECEVVEPESVREKVLSGAREILRRR